MNSENVRMDVIIQAEKDYYDSPVVMSEFLRTYDVDLTVAEKRYLLDWDGEEEYMVVTDEGVIVNRNYINCREDLARQVAKKMKYMCRCENCINTVVSIIKGTVDGIVRESSCEKCDVKDTCRTYERNSREREE